MFKIENGRLSFYQWDINQRLIVEDASITEVHFCNKTSDCSLVCAVYEEDGKRLVDVPNILLQEDWTINVFAYSGNYARYEETFIVYSRTKPDNYIYNETEVKSFELLEKRMDALEDAFNNIEIPEAEGFVSYEKAQNLTEEQRKIARDNIAEYYDYVEAAYFMMKQNIADCCEKFNYPQGKMDMELANSIPSISLPSCKALGMFAVNLNWMIGSDSIDSYVATIIEEFENMKANGVFSSNLIYVALGNSKKELTNKIGIELNTYGGNYTHRINISWNADNLSGDIYWNNNTKTIYSNGVKRKYINTKLNTSNYYADAKAVGDRFTELEGTIESLATVEYVDNAVSNVIGGGSADVWELVFDITTEEDVMEVAHTLTKNYKKVYIVTDAYSADDVTTCDIWIRTIYNNLITGLVEGLPKQGIAPRVCALYGTSIGNDKLELRVNGYNSQNSLIYGSASGRVNNPNWFTNGRLMKFTSNKSDIGIKAGSKFRMWGVAE